MRNGARILLAGLLIGFGASCSSTSSASGSHGYPSYVERSILRGCENSAGSGSASACQCALDKIENSMSYDDFKKLSDRYDAGDSSASAQLVQYGLECAGLSN